MVRLWLRDKGLNPGLMHASMSFQERKELQEGFEEMEDDSSRYRLEFRTRFLVGTTGTLGTGLNLAEACKMVIMEKPQAPFLKGSQYVEIVR